MTRPKLLATAMVALMFLPIASPGFAANSNDGVTSTPNAPADPAARQRYHHKHKHHHHHPHQREPMVPIDGPA